MENKKTKLTISGSAKKTIKNIEIARTQGKHSVVIEKSKSNFQKKTNRSLEGSVIEVLVENKVSESPKYFGRTGYMTSVIFDGKDEDVGKLVKVKINSSNQNTLFGETLEISKLRVA